MTALKVGRPPTYRWVPLALLLALPASAALGWSLFWLVSR